MGIVNAGLWPCDLPVRNQWREEVNVVCQFQLRTSCDCVSLCVCVQYAVTLNDFYDLMLSHRVSRDDCVQVAL